MKIDIQPRDDHQVKIVAEVEPERFEKSKRRAARKISQQTKIPGFRPGKAPYDIVRRTVGEQAITQEAVELLVDEVYPEIIKESEISPFGPGSLEEIANMDPVTFSFVVPLTPTIDLGDYRSIRVPYEPSPLDEKQVDQFIERLRYSYATVQPAERPAREGDLVFLTVTGKRANPAEGDETAIVEERPLQVTIDKEDDVNEEEWPFPGFSRMLIGMSASEEKTIPYEFPEETKFEALRGKEVEFLIKIQSVKSMELPELNDEFAQTMGEFENLDALRSTIRTNLENSAKSEYDQSYFSRIVDQIKEKATIKFPPQALDDEIQSTQRNLEADLARQNMDLETYLKVRNTDRDSFIEKELKPSAKTRLERTLLLEEIARTEKIELKQDELEQSFNETLADLQYSEDFQKMSKNVPAQRLANAVAMEAASRLMNRRVFDRLKKIATGEAEAEPVEAEANPIVETNQPEETAPGEANAVDASPESE